MIDAHRIKQLLKDRDKTQSDLARLLGVSPSAISQVLKGKTKDSRLLPGISTALGASIAYLKGETDDPFDPVDGSITPKELASQLKLKLSGVYVRGLEGEEKDDIDSPDHLDYDWLMTTISRFDPSILDHDDPEFFPPHTVLRAATDAMSPTINKGDQVTISLLSTNVDEPDAIWLINYGGLKMLRRLMRLPDGAGFRIYADNPASPTFTAPDKDIYVHGRAFWLGRYLA